MTRSSLGTTSLTRRMIVGISVALSSIEMLILLNLIILLAISSLIITYFLCSLVPSAVKLHLVSESSIMSPFSKEHLHSGASSLKNLASYRMASLTGANGRTVFKILTITAILVPLVSLISTLSIISAFGVGKTSQASWAGIINAVISKAEGGNTPMAPPWTPYAILGLWS